MMQATSATRLSARQWQQPLAQNTTTFAEATFADGVSVRGFAHRSYRLDAMPGCSDHLVAYRVAGVAKARRWLEGKVSRAITRPGSFTIIPALQESGWEIEGRGRLLYFFLPPALVRRVVEDELELGAAASTPIDRLGIHDPQMAALAEQFVGEIERGAAGWSVFAESITIQLAVLLARAHSTGAARPLRLQGGLSLHAKRRVLDFIETHLERDIALSDLAREAGLALSHFSHSFRATFDCAPYQYVLRRRAHRARELLESGGMPLAQVALAAGFANQAHLTTQFKRVLGVTPAAYRAGHGRAAA